MASETALQATPEVTPQANPQTTPSTILPTLPTPDTTPQTTTGRTKAQVSPPSSTPQPRPATAPQLQFGRLVMKGELIQLRPFCPEIANSRCWKDDDDFKEAIVKLFIHELFCLRKWRKRDRELGGKLIESVPDIVNKPDRYREHVAAAQRWVAAEKQKVEAWEAGEAKTAGLEGIDLHEDWLRAMEAKMDKSDEE